MTATPAATPMILGVTVEAIAGGSPEAPEPAEASPTPYDETLPAWTVMVYSSADTPGWSYAWQALNQMEAAGASNQVQVVAAIDWPEGTETTGSLPGRYVIRGNNDPTVITSEEAIGAEETNFGDPRLLADFIGWAMETYPANHTALILDGYGSGWRGCCLDFDPASDGPADFLSLAEIAEALDTVVVQTGAPLDVMAFSGSMMGQIEVLQALTPYVAYGVGSAAPVPAGGWDYQTLLGALYANPWMEARELAALLATDYVAYQRQLLGNEFAAMTAVDLTKLEGLTTAVESLALALTNDTSGAALAAADARRGAQSYGAVLADLGQGVTAVDLGHAAALLSQQASSADLSVAARAVVVAAGDAVVAQAAGQGLPFATGLSIYWPTNTGDFNPAYPAATTLPAWSAFLDTFIAGAEVLEAPYVDLTSVADAQANQSSPVLLRSEVIGHQIETIQLLVTQPQESGDAAIVQIGPVPPPTTPTTDTVTGASAWPDGRHATTLAWVPTTGYLYDAAGASSAALLRPTDHSPVGSLIGVSGDFLRQDSSNALASVLDFPAANAVPSHVWHLADADPGPPFVHEVESVPGDQFTPRLYTAVTSGDLEPSGGAALTFDAIPTLYRSTRALDNGSYAVGVAADVVGGNRNIATVSVAVDRSTAVAGYLGFAMPELGLSFVYPEGWTAAQNGRSVRAHRRSIGRNDPANPRCGRLAGRRARSPGGRPGHTGRRDDSV